MIATATGPLAHTPGRLVPVIYREKTLAETKVGRGSIRWIYDTSVTLACGCVYMYPGRENPRRTRMRCKGEAVK